MRAVYTLCRYFAAFAALLYGFAKLTGAQFHVLESVLDLPLSEVPGFWLVWYFFGYSQAYGNGIALAQIGCGVLLFFRRTTLLGSLILLGIMLNILAVDILYGVDLSGTLSALAVTAAVGFIVWQHRSQLVDFFWSRQNPVLPPRKPGSPGGALRGAVRGTLVAVALAFAWWSANFNIRVPTPLDGVWDVEEVEADDPAFAIPTRVYFERNRGFMAVFAVDGETRQHHFGVDPGEQGLLIQDRWMSPGDTILVGSYRLEEDLLVIHGRTGGAEGPAVRMILSHVRGP